MHSGNERRDEGTPPGARRRRDSKASFHSASPKTHPRPQAKRPTLPGNKLLGTIVQEESAVPLSPKKVRAPPPSISTPLLTDEGRDKVPQRQRPPSSEVDHADLKHRFKKMERKDALVKESGPEGILSPRKKGKVTSPRSRLKENQLKERPIHPGNSKTNLAASGNKWTVKSEAHELTKKDLEDLNPLLLEVVDLPGNEVCADCNRKKPSWCSLSLGVLLCVKCSSVHRGFGNQHTIRSLVLDNWHDEDIQRVKSFGGNSKINSIRESGLELSKKPTWDSLEDDRKLWIRNKYPPETTESSEVLRPPSSPPNHPHQIDCIHGHLNINLIGGRNLPTPEGKFEIHPYCLFKIGGQEIKSTIVKNSLSPYWGEYLRLPVKNKKDLVHIFVKSWNSGSGVGGSFSPHSNHDFLGSATISIEELTNEKPFSLWVRLENVKHGLLHLELSFSQSLPTKSD